MTKHAWVYAGILEDLMFWSYMHSCWPVIPRRSSVDLSAKRIIENHENDS